MATSGYFDMATDKLDRLLAPVQVARSCGCKALESRMHVEWKKGVRCYKRLKDEIAARSEHQLAA